MRPALLHSLPALCSLLAASACGPLDLGGAADLAIAPEDAAVADASAPPTDLTASTDLALDLAPADLRRLPDLAVEPDLICVAHVVAMPAALALGKVPADQPSTRAVLTLTNDSRCELHLQSAQLIGPGAAAFELDVLKLPWPLGAGQSFPIGVRLMAPAGSYTALLEIGTDIASQPRISANVDGTCVKGNARISVDVAQLSFGSQQVGVQSPWRLVTLGNSGPADLHLGALTVGGGMAVEFSLDTAMLKRVLPMGASTSFGVAFRPAALGARAASLSIASDDPMTPVVLVPLDGVGK